MNTTLSSLLNNLSHGWGLSDKSFPSPPVLQSPPGLSGPEGCSLCELSATPLLTAHLTCRKQTDRGTKDHRAWVNAEGLGLQSRWRDRDFSLRIGVQHPKNQDRWRQYDGTGFTVCFHPTPSPGLWIRSSKDFLSTHLPHLNRRQSIFNTLNLL